MNQQQEQMTLGMSDLPVIDQHMLSIAERNRKARQKAAEFQINLPQSADLYSPVSRTYKASPRANEHEIPTRQMIKSRSVELFSIAQSNGLIGSAKTSTSENLERITKIVSSFIDNGHTRPLSTTSLNWLGDLDHLAFEHPNFKEVIDMNIKPSISILAAGGLVRPIPIILLGSPGVGKSYFSQRLAQILNAPSVKIDMAAAQSGSSITGSDVFWSNTQPGQIFNTLIFGAGGIEPTIDPVIFLDEIDKASSSLQYNPIAGLYSLLEVESAKHFEDESMPGLKLNASFIRWIMAANNIDAIPDPIQSRCHIFTIPDLTTAQKIHTFSRIFALVVASCELIEFDDTIETEIIEAHIMGSMRDFKMLSAVAVGRALCDGRLSATHQDFATPKKAPSKTIGFVR